MDAITSPDRLGLLRSTRLLDSAPEEGFDRFTRLAKLALGVPVSLVSLVDHQRQFFLSADGLAEPWASRRESPLSQSMCKRVVADGKVLIVSNLRADPRFAGDRGAAELGVVAYLGFPIRLRSEVLGSFCVIDTRPHEWAEREVAIVRDLAAAVESEIVLRETMRQGLELAREAAGQDMKIALVLDAIGEGVYGVDLDGKCTFINRAAREMLGYELDQVLGQDMHELIHHTRPDGSHYPRSECTILRGGQSGRVVQLENELLWRRDGTPLLAEYSSYPLRVEDQQLGSVLTFNSSKLREDAHRRLSVHHAVSRAFAEPGGEADVISRVLAEIGTGLGWDIGTFWTHDSTREALHCTATWASQSTRCDGFLAATRSATLTAGHGLPGEVWQRGEPQIVADILTHPHFMRHDQAEAAGLRVALAFPAMAGSERVGVLEFYMRRQLDEEELLLQSVMTLGELIGQFLKRKRTEDELVVMRRAIESTSTGIVISDARSPSLPLTYCNPAFETITGYTPDEAVGRNCRFLQSPETSQHELDEVRAALRERRNCRVVLHNTRKDGSAFWNELTLSPVIRSDGALTHYIGVQVDVTERRRAEDALAAAKLAADEANLAKSQFIANMSHELRTPLAAVIGYTQLLEEEVSDLDVSDTHTILDDIRKIRGSAVHLLKLINEVLDLSKIEAGKMELQLEDFELGPLMDEVIDTVHGLVKNKSNTIVADFDSSNLGRMHSDPVKLRQCLLNLISNAAKFTENGQIVLHARREPGAQAKASDRLRVSVSDTGIGMTQEQLGRLFTRFTQADSSTTRRFGGTGLGLALTKLFCSMLGGDISVSSEPGRGTKFEFCLPADATEVAPPASDTQQERPEKRNNADVVLVIDDDASTRDLITRFLAREGLASEAANNGEDGLALARRLKPRAILLDVLMPRMDGWTVLAALKADPELNAIPVIMVSVVQERGLAFSLGAADFITKPVDWNRLRHTVERHRAGGLIRTALLIEHDATIRGELTRMLVAEGWSVFEAALGEMALQWLDHTRPDVILLDLQAPEPGGLTLLNELRHAYNGRFVPVIAIVEQSIAPEERERLQGQVRRIIAADEGQMLELASELRRIATTRVQTKPPGAIAAEDITHV